MASLALENDSSAGLESLPLPPVAVETPCFVILEDAVLHNLMTTAERAGGVGRLMPHIKTHRAQWIVELMVARGVTAFKAATPAEVEIALAARAAHVVWAYPTVNRPSIARVIEAASRHPDARVTGLVDSNESLDAWIAELASVSAANVRLRVDLDPGMGRTGINISADAITLAGAVKKLGRFDGWHAYDGHIQERDVRRRAGRINELAERLRRFLADARRAGLDGDLIAAGSYSFYLWPCEVARWVSPGSFTFSSSQHASDLSDVGWRIAAYVVATVLSVRDGTATLDAGSKAISPDMPMTERFCGPGDIKFMKEEHVVVATDRLAVGQRVVLVPRHGCTAAYLYDRALVRRIDGSWAYRPQLGARRYGADPSDTI